MVPPTGGAKDVTPPKVTSYKPANKSKFFKAKSFAITFDEYVDVKEASSQIVVSPPLNEPPEIIKKGKSIIVKWTDTLKQNTTYTVNFGNSIADVNEGNVLDNLVYAFTTGAVIDSLSMQGTLVHGDNLLPEKGVLVMLYTENAYTDSTPYKVRPNYFAKTNAQGHYVINNIAEGRYRLFALKDENANYKFDQPSEAIAFVDSMVTPVKKDSLLLKLFVEEYGKQYVKKTTVSAFGSFKVVFNKPVKNPMVLALNKPQQLDRFYALKNKMQDTIDFWLKTPAKDSANLILLDGQQVIDTLHLAWPIPNKNKAKVKTGMRVTLNVGLDRPLPYFGTLNLQMANPIERFDGPKIQLMGDSIPVQFQMDRADSVSKSFAISHEWKDSVKYTLFIPLGAITDIYGNINDTVQATFEIRPYTEYGTLTIKPHLPLLQGTYILQLVDEKDNIITERQFTNATISLAFEHLSPQKCRLKLVFDTNDDGKWTTGNYLLKRQPERVIYFNEPIEIRANWDLDYDWIVKE